MTLDWSILQEDVKRLYLQEDKTAKETIDLLNEKHRSNITLRQFKLKFKGLKNLQAREWKTVIHEIRKQEAEGKQYDVYLHNRLQNSKRVQRATQLYRKESSSLEFIGIGLLQDPKGRVLPADEQADLGIDTINKHRIEIRKRSDCDPIPINNGKAKVDPCGNDTKKQELSKVPPQHPHPGNEFFRDTPFLKEESELQEQFLFNYDKSLQNQSQPKLLFDPDPAIGLPDLLSGEELSVQGEANPTSDDPSDANDISPFNFEYSFFDETDLGHIGFGIPVDPSHFYKFDYDEYRLPEIAYSLFWDLQEIHNLIPETIISNGDTHSDYGIGALDTGITKQERDASISSQLVKADSRLKCLKEVAFQVETIVSNRISFRRGSRWCIDDQNLNLIFSVIVYLVSNNILDEESFCRFIIWVLDNQFSNQLNLFLHMNFSYALIFRNSLLQIIPKLNCYNSSKWTQERILNTYPDECLEIIQMADKSVLKGRLGTELLIEAIRSNHREAIEYLVQHDVNVNGDYKPYTPLGEAAKRGLTDIISLLLDAGADPNCHRQSFALGAAVADGNVPAVKLLLEKGAEVDLTILIQGVPILQWARERSAALYEILQTLSIKNEMCQSYFIMEEAIKGEYNLGRYLPEYGIYQDETLEQALCFAIKSGSDEAVRTLLSYGVDPKVQKYKAQYTSIDTAIPDEINPLISVVNCESHAMQNILYYLKKAGLEVDRDTLQYCHQKYEIEQLKSLDNYIVALAKAGFNIMTVGPSALEVVATRSNQSSDYQSHGTQFGDALFQCCIWLDLGCPIDEYGLGGLTGLQAAAMSGNQALVFELIKRGANVNLPAASHNGLTALQAAVKGGRSNIIDFLLSVGANCGLPPAENNGFTVLEAAAYAREKDAGIKEETIISILHKLLNKGAPINRDNGNANRLLVGLIISDLTDCLDLVLQRGAQMEETISTLQDGTPPSPLQTAALQLNLRAVTLLMSKWVETSAFAQSADGHKALGAAMSVCESLSEKWQRKHPSSHYCSSADSNSRGEAFRKSSFAYHTNLDITKVLISPDIKIDDIPAARLLGLAVLQGAAIQGHVQFVRLLLEFGIYSNISRDCVNGQTAVEAAAENGRMDVLKLLLSYDRELSEAKRDFSRAIELAAENGHLYIENFLRSHSARYGTNFDNGYQAWFNSSETSEDMMPGTPL